MKFTLTKFLMVFAFLFSFKNHAQQAILESSEKNINPEDLEMLLGDWTGSLTYIDYSSNKPYTMPANLNVKQGKNTNQLSLFFIYPNEPKANSKGKITVSKNGEKLNGKVVKSKQVLSNGQIQIITENNGKDNNMKAIIRNMYILGSKQFVIRKEVKFENSEDWLKRNEYNFER